MTDRYAHLKERCQYHNLREIPGFPVSDLDSLRQRIATGDFTLRVDATAALRATEAGMLGSGVLLLTAAIGALALVLAAVLTVAAFMLSEYHLLWGIPSALLGQLLANPYNRAHAAMARVASVVAVVSIWLLYTGDFVLASVTSVFAVAFWLNRVSRFYLQRKLGRLALQSEALLIAMCESKALWITDARTGHVAWHWQQ